MIKPALFHFRWGITLGAPVTTFRVVTWPRPDLAPIVDKYLADCFANSKRPSVSALADSVGLSASSKRTRRQFATQWRSAMETTENAQKPFPPIPTAPAITEEFSSANNPARLTL